MIAFKDPGMSARSFSPSGKRAKHVFFVSAKIPKLERADQSKKRANISTHNCSDFAALKQPFFQQVGDTEFDSDVDCLRCPIRTCHLKQPRGKLAVGSGFGAPPREQSTSEKLRQFCVFHVRERTRKKGLRAIRADI